MTMRSVPVPFRQSAAAPPRTSAVLAALLGALLWGCSSAAPPPRAVVPASPPKDDGRSSEGGAGGVEHAAALEELKVARIGWAVDKQHSVLLPLPDASHWMRVKFWGVPTLLGFRYGQGHHAVVGGYVTHVPDNTAPGACAQSFEKWALPLIDAYDIEIRRDPPTAVPWGDGHIADIETLEARAATVVEKGTESIAYAVYPAWTGACLVVGVAVPARDGDLARATAVRDRFVREVLPKVRIIRADEPKDRF
jgi:hypothetical protein